jgi:hypothetical protein
LTPVTGDLLGASSLLAALLGLLYGAWYPEITAASRTTIPGHDAAGLVKATAATLRTRALPLVAVAGVLTAILAPPAVSVVVRTAQHLVGVRHGGGYDAVQACFVAVFAVIAMLLVMVSTAALRVRAQLHKLQKVAD